MNSQDTKRPVLEVWEPTYRMKPAPEESFIPVQVESIIKEVLERRLRKVQYDEATCRQLSQELCVEIKDRVKELNLPRYKIVLQSVIGEVQGQGAFTASRCLWDTEVDNYASYSFKNTSLFCVVMVFGIYVD